MRQDGPVSDTAGRQPSTSMILGLVAGMDILLGIVLAFVGVSQDMFVFSMVGLVLLLSGGAMLAWVVWMRNKPEPL
jgi:hypothetical protein